MHSNLSEHQEPWPAPIDEDRSDIADEDETDLDDEDESELQHAIQDEFMSCLSKRNDASLVADSWPNSGEADELGSRPSNTMQLTDNENVFGYVKSHI